VDAFYFSKNEGEGVCINLLLKGADSFEQIKIKPKSVLNAKLSYRIDCFGLHSVAMLEEE
jgi:hypothetical protein